MIPTPVAADESPRRRKIELLSLLDEKAKRQAERSLRAFVPQAWPIIDPAVFVPNWHCDAIADHLQATLDGDILKLCINCPPRNTKSRLTSVLFPAWAWIRKPSLKIMSLSYSQERATDDAVKSRRLMDHPWYRVRWGGAWRFTSDQNIKSFYENNLNGFRFSSGFDGGATGQGGDIIIVDDPVKLSDGDNLNALQHVVDVYDGVLSSRLNDPKVGIRILIMQRLHERDLTGHVLAEEGWVHLRLPARYEPAHRCRVILKGVTFFEDPRTVKGELLNPKRFDEQAVTELFRAAGTYRASGQQQQRPAPAEGGIFKRAWWHYYPPEVKPRIERLVLSVDPNLRAKERNDLAAVHAWGAAGADRYFLRRASDRWDLPELKQQIIDMHRWARERFVNVPITVLVENTAVGPDVIAQLQRKIPGILPVTPHGDKVQRANAVTPEIESGNVFLPGAPGPEHRGCDEGLTPLWVQEFIDACAGFPTAEHDDDVDAMSQALLRLQKGGGSHLAEILETSEDKARAERKREGHDGDQGDGDAGEGGDGYGIERF